MRAAVLNRIGDGFQIEDIDIDQARGREVLVQVKASGLCHSDLHMAGNETGVPLPAVLGHELAGIVKTVGPDVREFATGDHVVASLVQFCGHCDACLSGRTYQCLNPHETLRGLGDPPRLSRDGRPLTAVFGTAAFAEFALVHENQLVKVPRELPFPQAALLGCGCITGAGAVINTARVSPGETVAVVGIGGVGLNVLSGARLVGAARIIAIDIQAEKEALARRFGATDFIDSSIDDPIEAVRELTGGGVHHAFEAVGQVATSRQAMKMTKLGGATYLIGVQRFDVQLPVDVTADLLVRQISLQGVYMGSSNIKRDIPMYASLYLQGRLNLDDLISAEINISEINEAYAELKSGKVARSVITSF